MKEIVPFKFRQDSFMSDSRHEWFFEETENLINTLNQVELLIIQLRSRMHGVGLCETERDYEDRGLATLNCTEKIR